MPDIDRTDYKGPDSGPRGMGRAAFLFIFIAILGAGAILRLYFFNGLRGHDDFVYLYYTRHLYQAFDLGFEASYWNLRLVIMLPMVALFKIFGPSYTAAFLPAFMLSIFTMVLASLTALELYKNYWTAILAMLLMALFPLDAFVASTIRGDVEISFYVSGALFLYLLARRFMLQGVSIWKGSVLLVLSGICAGMAYGSKQIGLLAMLAFLVIFTLSSIRKRALKLDFLLIVLGFLIYYTAESSLIASYTGDFFSRFRSESMMYNTWFKEGGYFQDRSLSFLYLPCLLSSFAADSCTQMINWGCWENSYTTFGPYYCFIFASFLFLLFSRDKGSYILLIWFAVILLYLQFGTISPVQYIPSHKEPRYLTIVSVPAVVILARGLYLLFKKSIWPKVAVFLIIIALAASSVVILRKFHAKYTEFNRNYARIWDFVKERKGDNFWADAPTVQYLELKSGYGFSSQVHKFEGKPGYGKLEDVAFMDCDKLSQSWVIMTKTIYEGQYEGDIPGKRCLYQLPASWILMKVLEKEGARAEIYFVP